MEEDKNQSETPQQNASLDVPDENATPTDAPTSDSPIDSLASSGLAGNPADSSTQKPKSSGGVKALLRKFNIYFLVFIFLLVVAVAVTIITYLNANKSQSTTPNIISQNLSQDELKQLDNSSAVIGGTGRTLTLQGNTIFTGQALIRSDLAVAGNLKLGGNITAQNITASGTANLKQTQAESLQVANSTVIKGDVTLQSDLNVAGAASFSGPLTAKKITVSELVLSSSGPFNVPGHIVFNSAPTGGSSMDRGALGSGGSASVSGSDTAGTINISIGGGPSAGCFITVNFSKAYSRTPSILMTPVNNGGLDGYYVKRSATSMSLCSSKAPPANQQFSFDYFVAG